MTLKRGEESDALVSECLERVANYFDLYYGVSLESLEITNTPGYWRDRVAKIHPHHPLHGCLGCSGPFKATYRYYDPLQDSNGRFQSRYKTWKIIAQAQTE